MIPSVGSFPSGFDGEFTFGSRKRCRGYFGQDVLRGLVSGIDEFCAASERQRSSRTLGPAMLAGFMWLDDDELVQRIADFPAACVVVTKQARDKYQQARLDKLKPVLERGTGFPAQALPELASLVFREDGEAPIVGPYTVMPRPQLPTLRTIGYRKSGNRLVPILHTKMVLLGELWWHDEDALGHVTDVIGFRPQRLWLSSANGTASSRRNLEFGLWLDDADLLRAAKKFMAQVLRYSEDLDPDAYGLDPDLVEPDYDDEEFAEVLAAHVNDDGLQ
jgi:hypothetical protein